MVVEDSHGKKVAFTLEIFLQINIYPQKFILIGLASTHEKFFRRNIYSLCRINIYLV